MKRPILISAGLLIGSVLSTALGGGTALAASSPAQPTTSPAAACTDGQWPSTVDGRPTLFHSGALAGDYIWHDSTGWHLRVTRHADDRLVFSGRITSSAPLDADPVKLEKGDQVTVSPDRKTITFRFMNYGAVDGIDFRTACAQRLTFALEMGGSRTPVDRIWLGAMNLHPLEDPLVVVRIG